MKRIVLDRDECFTYFLREKDPRFSEKKIIELTEKQLKRFKKAEDEFWKWQYYLDELWNEGNKSNER